MPVCVLYDVLKNSEFPVWNDFQFCFTARQVDRVKKIIILLLSAHAQMGQIQSQSPANLQVHFPIHGQNITFNSNQIVHRS